MQCAKDDFAIAMGIRRMEVAFDDVIVHQPVTDIVRIAFSRADDGVMPQEVSFVEEGIGTDTLVLADILEGVVGIQRVHGHAVFLAITRGMQSTGVAAIELGELRPVHELYDPVIGRMQVVEGKVAINRGFEFGLVDPLGNPGDLANADEASVADDPGQKGLLRGLGAGILDVPGRKSLQKPSEPIDRREHFYQGDIPLGGEEVTQWFTLILLGFRGGDVERPVFVEMEVWIRPVQEVLIGLVVLLIKPLGERVQGLLAVGHRLQVRTLQILVSMGLPERLGNQIVIQRPVFVGVLADSRPQL